VSSGWLLLLLVGFSLFSCSHEAKILSLDLDVNELVCEDGQKLFEGRILELDGITAVTVNIEAHKAMVKFRDSQLNEKMIIDHILDFGFTVNGLPGNPAAHRRLPACCLSE
jgi:copper chaperone CopZ